MAFPERSYSDTKLRVYSQVAQHRVSKNECAIQNYKKQHSFNLLFYFENDTSSGHVTFLHGCFQ